MADLIRIEGAIPDGEYEQAYEFGRRLLHDYIAQSCSRPKQVTVTHDAATDEWVGVTEVGDLGVARIRRITGYCSNYTNWNPAKRAELADRKSHA